MSIESLGIKAWAAGMAVAGSEKPDHFKLEESGYSFPCSCCKHAGDVLNESPCKNCRHYGA